MTRGHRPTSEQVIARLREAEVLIAQGKTVDRAPEQIGVTVRSYNR